MVRRLGPLVLALVLGCSGEAKGPRDAADTADVADDAPLDTGAPDGVTPDTAAPEVTDTIGGGDSVDGGPDGSIPAGCDTDSECRSSCALGRCELGRCVFEGPDPLARGCVVALAEGLQCVPPGAADPARDGCFFCNPFEDVGAFKGVAFGEGFESGAGRVLVEKLTPSPASWTISTRRAATGARSLYFGDPATLSYDVGERAAALAVTPPLALPEGGLALQASFRLWADTEETPGFDRLRVLVLGADGVTREVWSSDAIGGTTRGEFIPLTVDLGLVGPGDRVGFEADSIDEVINGYEGFYLDDARLSTACCDALRPCDDRNACTADRCDEGGGAAGECAFEPIAGCCLRDLDCDDGLACTADRCDGDASTGGSCVSTPIVGCCEAASDCDDQDPCSEDRCALAEGEVAGSCQNAPLCCASDADCDDRDGCTIGTCSSGQCRYRSACCREDVDCDDGAACTTDVCVAGTCRNDFSYSPGCCIPDVLTERFDGGNPPGWVLSPPTNNVGWRLLASPQARSGTHILYYGHPTLGFYESGGRNTGTATTAPIRLPDGVELVLSLMVMVDVEMVSARDVFRVEALVGTGGQVVVPLVDKAELTRNSWQELQVDLSWAASETVQLRFFFDSVDGSQNTSRGLFVDDVRLLSSCLARGCATSAECPSRASCIAGECASGTCDYASTCP